MGKKDTVTDVVTEIATYMRNTYKDLNKVSVDNIIKIIKEEKNKKDAI